MDKDSDENQTFKPGKILKFLQRIGLITIAWKPDGSLDVTRMFTINHESQGYLYFNLIVTVACLLSSYMYVYMAAHRISVESIQDPEAVLMVVFEVIFLIDILVNFMLSYEHETANGRLIETRVDKIATNYFKSNFIRDLIPVLPLQLTNLANNRECLFFLIKLMRLMKGF